MVMEQEEEKKAWVCSQRGWLKKKHQGLGGRKLVKNMRNQNTSAYGGLALPREKLQVYGQLVPPSRGLPSLELRQDLSA